jgi:hypothetical protein
LTHTKHYGPWEEIVAGNAGATFSRTFSEPFIGQIRVTLKSGDMTTYQLMDFRAKAAYPVNVTVTTVQEISGFLHVKYAYQSSSTRLPDLDNVEMGEYYWYTNKGRYFGPLVEATIGAGWIAYEYRSPFDFTDYNGHYKPFDDPILGFFQDDHGERVAIVGVGSRTETAQQYLWYKINDGYNYSILNDGGGDPAAVRSDIGGDVRGEVKFRWSTIQYNVAKSSETTVNYKIVKRTEGAVEAQTSNMTITPPWQAGSFSPP